METIEQPRTELRPASSLALVVICLGYFMVIVDSSAGSQYLRDAQVKRLAGSVGVAGLIAVSFSVCLRVATVALSG